MSKSIIDEGKIKCPVCSFESTHLRSGTLAPTRPGEDDSISTLVFACEDGHSFALNFKFHEGGTYVDSEILKGR
jgi:hypothetical protein